MLAGLTGCAAYFDDDVDFSDTWSCSKCECIVCGANLTVKLANCEFAKATVTYLCKVVGQSEVCPVQGGGH